MNQPAIHAITMPKWGMAMEEGTVTAWHRTLGALISPGDEVVDAESTKAAAAIESQAHGILRRIVAQTGDVVAVGGLLGVIAPSEVGEEDIDKFVAGFAPARRAAEESKAPAPERIQIAGARLNVLRLGSGTRAALFLHGFGGDLSSWQFNQPAIADLGIATIAFDLPGHGLSDPEVRDGRLSDLTQATRQLLDALELNGVHLIGHSLGGAIAMSLAVSEPARYESVTLIGSAGLGPEINQQYIDGFLDARRRNELKPIIALLFSDQRYVTKGMLEELIRTKRIDGVVPAQRRIAGSCFAGGRQADWELRSRFQALPMPTQVIWGAQDKIIPALHATGLGHVTIVENAGHMVHLEQAETVNALIGRITSGAAG